MQSAIQRETDGRFNQTQTSRLFNFEAEYSKDFAERTVVPPAIAENPAEVTSQLTDDVWLIINGEKGSGKTSYLYYTRHELRASSPTSIPLYVAFDNDDIKSEISNSEEKNHFLTTYFYRPLLRELALYLGRLPRRSKQTEAQLGEIINSLRLTENDLRSLAEIGGNSSNSSAGFISWLLKLLGLGSSGQDSARQLSSSGRSLQTGKGSPDYVGFRDALFRLTRSIGAQRVFLLIDEVNEQRLSRTQQQALFDHLYNTYRTSKDVVTVKIAKTSSVSVPDFIFHGHYFMPMELSSMLVHPYEYEEMLRSIFEVRLKTIRGERIDTREPGFADFFTETSFHTLAQASMGNVREFFFLSKMAYAQSLPEGKIEFLHAQRVIRSRASELEERLKERGGDALNSMYLHIVSLLKERSEAKLARKTPKEIDEVPALKSAQIEGGVSYFTISNFDALSQDDRALVEKLEEEKIIYGTDEWKSLRRKGAKQEMYVLSYLVCSMHGVKWHDVSDLVRQGIGTERELIDLHRCQISL